jgi:hypothetical protein
MLFILGQSALGRQMMFKNIKIAVIFIFDWVVNRPYVDEKGWLNVSSRRSGKLRWIRTRWYSKEEHRNWIHNTLLQKAL